MSTHRFEKLLIKMILIEAVGQLLYRVLRWKSRDDQQRAIYERLALNERDTETCIARELAARNRSLPALRRRLCLLIAQPVFLMIPRRTLDRILCKILRRRIFSRWSKIYGGYAADLWQVLVAHEELQHELLMLPQKF